jgi:hypothetical protein
MPTGLCCVHASHPVCGRWVSKVRGTPSQWPGIKFQKNKWSTRDSVTFDVNLFVVHQANNQSFERENVVARQLGKEIERPTSGNYFSRLSKLGEPRDNFPWTVTPTGPNDSVARDILESIRVHFLPVVEELRRPLVVPTPATERGDRASQGERNEAALAWHKEALERAGVRNPQGFDVNPETG